MIRFQNNFRLGLISLYGCLSLLLGCDQPIQQESALPPLWGTVMNGRVLAGLVTEGEVRAFSIDPFGQLRQDLPLGQAYIDEQGRFALTLNLADVKAQANDHQRAPALGSLVLLQALNLPPPFESLTLSKIVHLEKEWLSEVDTRKIEIDWISDWVSALSYYDVVPEPEPVTATRSPASTYSNGVVLVENAWTVARFKQSLAQAERLLLAKQSRAPVFGDPSQRYYFNQAWLALARASGLSTAAYWSQQRRQLLLRYSHDSVEQRYFPGQWLLDAEDPSLLTLKNLLQQAQTWALKDHNNQQAQVYRERLLTLNQDYLFVSDSKVSVQSHLQLPVMFLPTYCLTLGCKQQYASLYQQAQINLVALQQGHWEVLTASTAVADGLIQLEKAQKLRKNVIEVQPLWHQALVRMGVALLNELQQNPESPLELGVFNPEAEVSLVLDRQNHRFKWHWSFGVHQLKVAGRYQATEQDSRQYRIELTQPLLFQAKDLYWQTQLVQETPANLSTELSQPSHHFGYLVLLSDLVRNQVQYLSLHFPAWELYEANGLGNTTDKPLPLIEGSLEYGLQSVQVSLTDRVDTKLPAYNIDAIHLHWRLFPLEQRAAIDEPQQGWQLSYEGNSQRATTFQPAQTYPTLAIAANPWRLSGFLTPNDQINAPNDWPNLLEVRWLKDRAVLPEGIQPFLDSAPIAEAAQLTDPSGETWLMLYADGRYQPCDLKPKWVCADPQPITALSCLKAAAKQKIGASLVDIPTADLRLEHIMNELAAQGCFSQLYVPGYGVYSVTGQQPLFESSKAALQRFDGQLLYKDTLGLSNSYLNLAYRYQGHAKGFVWQLEAPVPGYRSETLAIAQGAADQQIYRPLPYGSELNLHWHQQQGTAKPSAQGFIKQQQQSLIWKQHPLGIGTFLYDKGQLIGRLLDQEESGSRTSTRVIFVDRGWLPLSP